MPKTEQASRRRRRLAIAVFGLAIAVLPSWSYFGGVGPGTWSTTSRVRDWVWAQTEAQTTRASLRQYGQLPQWDAWRLGGQDHLANPDSDLWSPWTLLTVFVDVNPALRIKVYSHLWLAFVLMWLWAKSRGLRTGPSLLAATVFALSGHFAVSVAWGFVPALGAAFLPGLMLLYERGREQWTATLGIGLVLAFMVLEGAMAAAQMAWLLLLLRVGYDLWWGRRNKKNTVLRFIAFSVVALALSAVKWLPVWLAWQTNPPPLVAPDGLLLTQLIEIFVGRDSAHWRQGFAFERFQYFNYMGPAVLLALLWLLTRLREAHLHEIAVVMALVVVLLLSGDQGSWLPYAWLQRQPLWRQALQLPARISILLSPWLALSLAYFVSLLQSLIDNNKFAQKGLVAKLRTWLFVGLFVAVTADQLIATQALWKVQPFREDPAVEKNQAFEWQRRDVGESYRLQRRGVGYLSGVDKGGHKAANALRLEAGQQLWLDDPQAGAVKLLRWTPQRWELDVDLQRGTTLTLNHNAAPGWTLENPAGSTLGAEIRAGQSGRKPVSPQPLRLKIGPGKGSLILKYHSPGFIAGAWISVLAWLGLSLGLLLWHRRRRHAD